MSRPVCGNCFCTYDDDGTCGCPDDQAHYKKVIDNVQALFEAKREQAATTREDWGTGPHECHSLSTEQPANQLGDIPKIGCVNHDCDKCKAQQQELDDLYAERKETVLGMLAYSTSLEEEIKRLREESQFNYMTGYEVARSEFQQRIQELEALLKEKNT